MTYFYLFFFILDSTYRWDHIVFVFLWLFHLVYIMSLRFIHVVTNSKVSLFNGWIICRERPHFLYPSIHWWTRRLPKCLHCCKKKKAPLVVQRVKNPPAMPDNWVQSLSWEDPWRRKWQPTPVFLPGESHRQRSLERYSPWSHKKIGHNWSNIACTHAW